MYQPFFTDGRQEGSTEKLIFDPNILLLNINTINVNKINNLTVDIKSYPNLNFLCLVETGVKPDLINIVHINGYKLVSSYCRSSFKCGGVGIWAKEFIDVKEINLEKDCTEQHFEICAASFKKNGTTCIILNCYRSPAGDAELFLKKIVDVLNKLFTPTVDFILCGDFNFDKYNNKYFNSLCTVLSSFNLISVIGWPTRVTGTTCTMIDHIFINFKNNGICSVLDNTISDHRTVFLELQCNTINSEKASCVKRSFNDSAILNFQRALQDENWCCLYTISEPNLAFNYFFETFMYYFNYHFPERRYYVNIINNKKWVNDTVRSSSTYLKDLFILKNIYPDLTSAYTEAKRKHSNLINKTKKEYYQSKIDNSNNPARAAWNTISEVSNKTKKHDNLIIKKDKHIIQNPKMIASLFNDFFINTPADIVNQIPQLDNTNVINRSKHIQHTLFLKPFSEDELFSLLNNKLKNKKSSGPDDVPAFLIKKILKLLVKPLTFLVNISFETGTFPDNLKIGKVVPILKKKDPNEMENYRPITIPSSFSKLFEYCYLDRLINFLKKYEILSENQHGFRCEKSTVTAVNSFYNKIIYYIEAGECPVGIFFDLSRAFDCVNHVKLTALLYDYGIRGQSLNWITSFLKDRQQYVSIQHSYENKVSKVKSGVSFLNMGVPQGSILGPVLFILYVNELNSVLCNEFFSMYADDLSTITSDCKENILIDKCNNVIGKISTFFNQHHLYLNSDKTQLIQFHNRQKNCPLISLNVDKSTITNTSDSVKFLGLYIDECLSWKSHCEHMISKLSSLSFLFKNIKMVLTKEQIVNLYYAQVDSRLRYGVCYWGNSTLSQNVFVSQKRILRCMAGISSFHSCKEVFREYKILTLPALYVFEMCVYVYKHKNIFSLNKDIHNLNTRSKEDVRVPYARLNITSNSPNYIGPKMFNHLPVECKLSSNLFNFKTNLKLFLLSKCLYSVSDFFT